MILDTPAIIRKTREAARSNAHHAGFATALADFRIGRFHRPVTSDRPDWVDGYYRAIEELAETFGWGKISMLF